MKTIEIENIETDYRRNRIHPKKFALYAACASMAMMFTAFTSAYLVRQAGGNWLEYVMPSIFYWNTLVILGSSVTLYLAKRAFLHRQETGYRIALLSTLALGLVFLGLQYSGWNQLMEMGVPLGTNPSGDFVYAVSGIHAAHLVGGITALLVTVLMAFMRPLRITPARRLRLDLVSIYWHFVGFLWLYLIGFWTLQG